MLARRVRPGKKIEAVLSGGERRLRSRRRQLSRYDFVGESLDFVGAIAEWLIRGVPAAAQGNHLAAGQAERGPGWVKNLKLALNAERAVVRTRNLGVGHKPRC